MGDHLECEPAALKVLRVKYLRHGPLLFWVLVVIALGAIFAVAVSVGEKNTHGVVRAKVVPDESPMVTAMLTRIAQVRAVSVAPAENLNAWGAKTEEMASENAQRRAAVAGQDDPIALAYAAIALDAQGFATVDESDADAILTLRGRIGISYDRLVAAAQGIKVPGLPDAPSYVDGSGGDNTISRPKITEEDK